MWVFIVGSALGAPFQDTLSLYRRKRVYGEPTGSLESLGLDFVVLHQGLGELFSYSRSTMGKEEKEKDPPCEDHSPNVSFCYFLEFQLL